MDLDLLRLELSAAPSARVTGRVLGVTGLSVSAALPAARIGDTVVVRRRGEPLLAEIVAFRDGHVTAMPYGDTIGVGLDDPVEPTASALSVRVGEELLGRVLDGLGRPIDGKGPVRGALRPLDQSPPPALTRERVRAPVPTGVRAIDGLLTLGLGQRIGLFSGSGVGKSTLLGALCRGTASDVVVVALVGERGREVREFVDETLDGSGSRAVVVAATSDAPALERLRAAQVATSVAEAFRDEGRNVLLLVDSITRVARAQREVGLAAGEPPVRRGYPPSVFAMLPRLLERSGQGTTGSITAVYAVLVEGGDLDEPVTDEVRGILDGHIVLSRQLAAEHHYPAIDVAGSVSRVMSRVAARSHLEAAGEVRNLLSVHDAKRDLVALGGYREGADESVDRAIRAHAEIRRFLRQAPGERAPFDETVSELERIARRHGVRR